MQSVLADAIHIVDCIVGIKPNYIIMMPRTICTVCIVGITKQNCDYLHNL